MHSASSVFSKPPLAPPNPLREDKLLEGFEQAGKQVTEHVLDTLIETAGAGGALLIFSPPTCHRPGLLAAGAERLSPKP